ncbi:MAG: hypothetical protein DHS20C18_09300 [Saprospiraceae bacterium]|nr:MAG: hypothetical protein DHS20C18_09300 [Saprospiraceae bacterium]
MVEQQGHPQYSRPPSDHDRKCPNGQENDFGSYRDFLLSFVNQDYKFIPFSKLSKPKGQLVLRHDIDFDTHYALDIAKVESDLGIKATYFFLLSSNFYNVLSQEDSENILKIKALGHTISLHFDSTVYKDYKYGLMYEVDLFEQIFDVKVKIISFHRPNEYFRKLNKPIKKIEHTYQSKFSGDIKYFSDSTGVWRFGHPLESTEFKEKISIQLLTHPIWWMVNGASNLEKLKTYYLKRTESLKDDFAKNCIPFEKICENLG